MEVAVNGASQAHWFAQIPNVPMYGLIGLRAPCSAVTVRVLKPSAASGGASSEEHGIKEGQFSSSTSLTGNGKGAFQGSEFVCSEKETYVKWARDLGESDFLISSDFKLDQLAHTATTFTLWAGASKMHIGLDGANNSFFTEGGAWGRAKGLQKSTATPGVYHTIQLKRVSGALSVKIDDVMVPGMESLPLPQSISAVGWRPWRNTVHIKNLYSQDPSQATNGVAEELKLPKNFGKAVLDAFPTEESLLRNGLRAWKTFHIWSKIERFQRIWLAKNDLGQEHDDEYFAHAAKSATGGVGIDAAKCDTEGSTLLGTVAGCDFPSSKVLLMSLLEAKAHPDLGNNGLSPVHGVINQTSGMVADLRVEKLSLLIRFKADLSLTDKQGQTPLVCSLNHEPRKSRDAVRTTKLILDAKANVDAPVTTFEMLRMTPLQWLLYDKPSSTGSDSELVELLVKAKANLEQQVSSSNRRTPSSPAAPRMLGATPLMLAVARSGTLSDTGLPMPQLPIVKWLVQAKADVRAKSAQGEDVLDFASNPGDTDDLQISSFLLEERRAEERKEEEKRRQEEEKRKREEGGWTAAAVAQQEQMADQEQEQDEQDLPRASSVTGDSFMVDIG
mmetsp:Transcript_79601/g.140506  ORF Transcript_79601/g.140506 Transcript_79601/m.140506 type:complete len:615 (-) Transcript_79601:330-2174(-)